MDSYKYYIIFPIFGYFFELFFPFLLSDLDRCLFLVFDLGRCLFCVFYFWDSYNYGIYRNSLRLHWKNSLSSCSFIKRLVILLSILSHWLIFLTWNMILCNYGICFDDIRHYLSRHQLVQREKILLINVIWHCVSRHQLVQREKILLMNVIWHCVSRERRYY